MTLFFTHSGDEPICVFVNRNVEDYIVRHDEANEESKLSIYRKSSEPQAHTTTTIVDKNLFSGSVFVKVKDMDILDGVQNITIEREKMSVLTGVNVWVFETENFCLMKNYLMPMPSTRNILFDVSDGVLLYYSNRSVTPHFVNLFLVNVDDGTFKVFHFKRANLGLFLFKPLGLQGKFLLDDTKHVITFVDIPTKKTTRLVQLCLKKTRISNYEFPDEIVEMIMEKAGYLNTNLVSKKEQTIQGCDMKRFENCMDFLPKLKNVI